MASFFVKVKISIFRPETMDYSPWFDFVSPKKVLRTVCHLYRNRKEKSNGTYFNCIAPSTAYNDRFYFIFRAVRIASTYSVMTPSKMAIMVEAQSNTPETHSKTSSMERATETRVVPDPDGTKTIMGVAQISTQTLRGTMIGIRPAVGTSGGEAGEGGTRRAARGTMAGQGMARLRKVLMQMTWRKLWVWFDHPIYLLCYCASIFSFLEIQCFNNECCELFFSEV